jgi:hypothetical protein
MASLEKHLLEAVKGSPKIQSLLTAWAVEEKIPLVAAGISFSTRSTGVSRARLLTKRRFFGGIDDVSHQGALSNQNTGFARP